MHSQSENDTVGAIAQLVEQRTENPCVPGSNPGGTTTKDSQIVVEQRFGSFSFSLDSDFGNILATFCGITCKSRWGSENFSIHVSYSNEFCLFLYIARCFAIK